MTDKLLLKTDQDNFQSLKNLKSIVACVKYMLNLGTPFIITEVFNQDILERQFCTIEVYVDQALTRH